MTERTRRQLLVGMGATAAAGALAGCSEGDGDDGGDGGDGEDGGDGGDGADRDTVEAPEEVVDYLSNTGNFDGEMIDAVDSSQVQIDVGAEGNMGNLAFGPAAIQIETGTEVDWEWTGQGGAHNVVADDDTFSSGNAVDEEGKVFSHTFEEAGTYLYACTPHEPQGMKGAVVVE